MWAYKAVLKPQCPHLQVGTAPTRTAMGLAPPGTRNAYHSPRTQGPGELGPHTALLPTPSRQSLTMAHFTRVPASRNLVFKRQIATLGKSGNSSKSTELPNDPALNSIPRHTSNRIENTSHIHTKHTCSRHDSQWPKGGNSPSVHPRKNTHNQRGPPTQGSVTRL